ncbi:hypothetical protein K490DRAFT_57493 [Saccharata proteae CBS 121410]|uniref:Uncharacterized protein n=1 Tax=Saccharata proteae CBS 121410 TaxID=1314787 RepID=A0A9P4HVU6_9PEZI|nr:hypothetical protein K490DRAFT_57493 [Saccharata proteae CBS 121410]
MGVEDADRPRCPASTKFVDGRMDGDLQKGNYSLVFKTITAARDYQNHLAKLHKLAKDYAPTSLYSPLAPAPGADDPFDTGENQERLLRSYALVPSSHILDNNIVMYPFPDDLLGILARGGYRAVVYGNDPATGTVFHKVLLTFEGMQPSLEMISLAFYRSGRLRGLPWGIANNDVKHFNEVSGKRLEPKAYYKKFVVPFEDEGNAQRFVRAWHRQRLNWWNDEWVTPRGMEDTMINATLLW